MLKKLAFRLCLMYKVYASKKNLGVTEILEKLHCKSLVFAWVTFISEHIFYQVWQNQYIPRNNCIPCFFYVDLGRRYLHNSDMRLRFAKFAQFMICPSIPTQATLYILPRVYLCKYKRDFQSSDRRLLPATVVLCCHS